MKIKIMFIIIYLVFFFIMLYLNILYYYPELFLDTIEEKEIGYFDKIRTYFSLNWDRLLSTIINLFFFWMCPPFHP